MRLSKLAFVVFACYVIVTFVFPARAAFKVESLMRNYDDGKTKVTSPHLDVTSTFGQDKYTIGIGYASDVVTSASSDVVSYGSGQIKETRKEYSAKAGISGDGGTFMANYIQSDENDYNSKTYGFSGSREFFEKNTTVGLSFNYGDDKISQTSSTTFKEAMTNQNYGLTLTQVLSKVSIAELIFDFRIENGYTASPYRKARIKTDTGTIALFPENHPKTRNRNAVAFKFNYFWVPVSLSLGSSLRLYYDSWDVKSATVEERITKNFGDSFDLSLNFRYYTQVAANFYKDTYSLDTGPFYTGNKTLSTYTSTLAGLRPTLKLGKSFEFFLKGEVYLQKFANHTDIGRTDVLTDDKPLEISATVLGAGLLGEF